MRKDKIGIAILISLLMISVIVALTDRPIRAQAQAAVSDSEISKKLDDILKNQKEMLQGIASIKEELEIIKIRVTR